MATKPRGPSCVLLRPPGTAPGELRGGPSVCVHCFPEKGTIQGRDGSPVGEDQPELSLNPLHPENLCRKPRALLAGR